MRSSYYLGKPKEEGTVVDPTPGTPEAKQLDIRLLAYDLWGKDNYPHSDGLHYWFEAEKWWKEEWEKRANGSV